MDHDAFERKVGEGAEALLAGEQLRFEAFLLGDVDANPPTNALPAES